MFATMRLTVIADPFGRETRKEKGCGDRSPHPIPEKSVRPLGLEIHSRVLAAILLNFVGDLLAFIEAVQTSALNGADVHEHILATAVRLNETETLGGVEPLNRTCSHVCILSSVCGEDAMPKLHPRGPRSTRKLRPFMQLTVVIGHNCSFFRVRLSKNVRSQVAQAGVAAHASGIVSSVAALTLASRHGNGR